MTTRINQFNIANTATPELAELTVTGNISANYFTGNGSQLTGLPEGYGNANVIALGESGWGGNIVPSANVTYDLGTVTNRWRDIYLAGNTIYLGEAEISANATSISMTNPRGGRITVNGTESDLVANLINAGNIEATNFMLSRGNLQALTQIYTGDAQQWLSDTDTEPLGRLNLVVADLPGPAEIIIVNRDDDALAYAEFLAINDAGNISSGFCGIGINSSTYSDPEYPITQADDGFLLYTAPQGSLSSGNLVIGTGDTGQVNAIVFGAGGFASGNTQMVIMPDDRVEIIIPTESTSANTGALVVDGGLGVIGNVNVGGNLSLSLTSTVTANNLRALQHVWSGPVEQWLTDRDESDTGRRIAAVANIAGPAETLQVNLSSDPLAYSEFLAINDVGNVSSGWISMGINSSTYDDPEFQLTGADDGYLLFESPVQTTGAGNLVIATGDQGGVNAIVFGAGGFATGTIKLAPDFGTTPPKFEIRGTMDRMYAGTNGSFAGPQPFRGYIASANFDANNKATYQSVSLTFAPQPWGRTVTAAVVNVASANDSWRGWWERPIEVTYSTLPQTQFLDTGNNSFGAIINSDASLNTKKIILGGRLN